MTEDLFKVDVKKVMSFDIETIPANMDFNENSPEYEMFAWKMRDKETMEVPSDPEIVKEYYYRMAGLLPAHCRIICISVACLTNEGKIRSKSFYGDNEAQILIDFVTIIKKHGYRMLGHNIIKFDLPLLRQRWISCGLNPRDYFTPRQGNDSMVKPWNLEAAVLDTIPIWQGTSYNTPSLEEITFSLGLPSPKENMKGSEVFKYYTEGRIKEIANYCEGDTIACLNAFLLMLGYTSVESYSVTDQEVVEEVVEIPDPIFRLNESGSFDHEMKAEIVEALRSKGFNKDSEDYAEVLEILSAAYLQPKERVGIQAAKIEELKEFLNGM